jgi:hypothetical protein
MGKIPGIRGHYGGKLPGQESDAGRGVTSPIEVQKELTNRIFAGCWEIERGAGDFSLNP